jgi:hypothetical protein
LGRLCLQLRQRPIIDGLGALAIETLMAVRGGRL